MTGPMGGGRPFRGVVQPQLSRTINCTGRTTSPLDFPLVILAYRTSNAVAPSSCIGWRTVVNGG